MDHDSRRRLYGYTVLDRPVKCVVCGRPCDTVHQQFDVPVHIDFDPDHCTRELRERMRASILANRWMHGSTAARRR